MADDNDQLAKGIKLDLSEIGSSGLQRFGGYVQDEWLRELRGPAGVKVLREMRDNDPIVGSVLFTCKYLSRGAKWWIEPVSQDTADMEQADFVRAALMTDMSMTWQDTLSEVLSMLPFGWSYCECVYKRRQGDVVDPAKRSRFTDGKIGWRKLPLRAQETLQAWDFDIDGGIRGMTQAAAPLFVPVTVPIEKALLFRTEATKGNPEGRSILRTAYTSWRAKRFIQIAEGIGVERDLTGYPVFKIMKSLGAPNLWNDQDAAATTLKTELKKVLRNIKRDEQEGLLIPEWIDFELKSSPGQRMFDTSAIIGRYNRDILTSVLADFIMLGSEKVGTYELAKAKIALFGVALGGFLDAICEVFNRFAIPRLLALNGWNNPTPILAHGDIEALDLKEIGAFLKSLADAGFLLPEVPGLLRHLLMSAKMPPPSEEEEQG